MSITRRLVFWLTLSIALLWLGTALITRSVFVDEIDEMRHDAIRNTAHRMMPLIVHVVAGGPETSLSGTVQSQPFVLDEDIKFLVSGIGGAMAFEVRDQTGKPVFRSYDARDVRFPDTIRPGLFQSKDILAYTLNDQTNGLSLTVVEPNAHRQEALSEATTALVLPLALLIPIMIAVIYLLIRLATQPIRDLRHRISLSKAGDPELLEANTKAVELRPIARAVDQLMKRLDATLSSERAFSANAAHELRTPVAGALVQTQRLRQELDNPSAIARVTAVEAALRQLADLTEKLLQVSRFETIPQIHTTREDLSRIISLIVSETGRDTQDARRINVENDLGQEMMVAIDPDIFAISLRNLIENAMRHGDPNGTITVRIAPDWTVRVINDGPALDPQSLEKLLQRYSQGDAAQSGHGLGLSIVERLMKQSGGGLRILSPATGRSDGFEAVLEMP